MMSWKGILRKFTVPLLIVRSTTISLIVCSSLLFAAMETTSGALARILQLLSEHQDVQEKLRQEIIAAHAEKETGLGACDTPSAVVGSHPRVVVKIPSSRAVGGRATALSRCRSAAKLSRPMRLVSSS